MSIFDRGPDMWLDLVGEQFYCSKCLAGIVMSKDERALEPSKRPPCPDCGGRIVSDRERVTSKS